MQDNAITDAKIIIAQTQDLLNGLNKVEHDTTDYKMILGGLALCGLALDKVYELLESV
jgi:hypothetical protein